MSEVCASALRDGQGRAKERQGQAEQLLLRQRPCARGHQGERRSFGPGGEEGRDGGAQGTREEGRGQKDRRQGVGARTAGVNEKPRIRGAFSWGRASGEQLQENACR